jgi:hypothetical protein
MEIGVLMKIVQKVEETHSVSQQIGDLQDFTAISDHTMWF